VREAIALIARLEPKPGRRFVDVERNIVVPDVLVRAGRQAERAASVSGCMLNPDVMPRAAGARHLRQCAAQPPAAAKTAPATPRLQQRLQEARWFIKNIQQRFDTILRVSTAIVERQKSFFTHGELAMRPLVLREIADELGLHESTISRVTTAKYMATPFGTFELKYFFGSGLGTESGGNAVQHGGARADQAVHRRPRAPQSRLSDSQLSDMLKEQGIECAAAHRGQIPRGPEDRPRHLYARRYESNLQLFLPCAAGVEELPGAGGPCASPACRRGCISKQRGGVAGARLVCAMRCCSEPAQPPGAAGAGAALVHHVPQRAGPVPRRHARWPGSVWFTPAQSIKVEVTAQHSPLTSA